MSVGLSVLSSRSTSADPSISSQMPIQGLMPIQDAHSVHYKILSLRFQTHIHRKQMPSSTCTHYSRTRIHVRLHRPLQKICMVPEAAQSSQAPQASTSGMSLVHQVS